MNGHQSLIESSASHSMPLVSVYCCSYYCAACHHHGCRQSSAGAGLFCCCHWQWSSVQRWNSPAPHSVKRQHTQVHILTRKNVKLCIVDTACLHTHQLRWVQSFSRLQYDYIVQCKNTHIYYFNLLFDCHKPAPQADNWMNEWIIKCVMSRELAQADSIVSNEIALGFTKYLH